MGLLLPPFSNLFAPARSLLTRFAEIAPNTDFISNSLFLKRHGSPVCESFMLFTNNYVVCENVGCSIHRQMIGTELEWAQLSQLYMP